MDLSFLRSLVDNPGPFLSVYLDTSGDDRGVAAQVRQARWRDLREELAKESDDTSTLDAVGAINISSQADVKSSGLNVLCEGQVGFTGKGSATAELSASGETVVRGAMVMIN